MTILRYIFIALEVVLLFNLLIGVHELGHFLAAKWRGLKIDRFAIWFGKPVWKKKIGGVEYALGWIPAGGYVALPQMATMEAIEGKTRRRRPHRCRMFRRWTKSSWRSPGRCSVSGWRLFLRSSSGASAGRATKGRFDGHRLGGSDRPGVAGGLAPRRHDSRRWTVIR